MTTDPIVTHADLDAIAVIERECAGISCSGEAAELLRRLRAAAEADAPPLPEGWVLYRSDDDDARRVVWHSAGQFWLWDDERWPVALDEEERDRFTPLRPAITEADVEKAAEALRADFHNYAEDVVGWSRAASDVKRSWIKNARAAFAAAGVVIEP